ncbi:MAG: TIGR03546 family protein [Deltaproteobacteria bacterium]|nr:TIGR03546 family protein [Deltaproteobacteria bacterium]
MRLLAKFLKVLNSNAEPLEISLALCLAMIAGLTPLMSLHNLPVLLAVLILRANLSAFILGLGLFSGIAYALDPLFHRLGLFVLTLPSLGGLWTSLYNNTLWRLEHFNNSIVMGSLLASLALFLPAFLLFNLLIRKYRAHVLQWVRKSRFMQMVTASNFYRLYQSATGWGGDL